MATGKIKTELKKMANPLQAKNLARFFKTGQGQYGAGDKFLGIMVPQQRAVAKKFVQLELADIQELLDSPWHEFRLTALLILVDKFGRAPATAQKSIVNFYLKNIVRINNWDLVDLTAPKILGPYFAKRPRPILFKLARSKNLWARRIAVLTTFEFIRQHDYADTLKLAELFLKDQHDLMHKAVGWMLRELGKRDLAVETEFLKQYYKVMPRTMLRYALEKFPESERQKYLKNLI